MYRVYIFCDKFWRARARRNETRRRRDIAAVVVVSSPRSNSPEFTARRRRTVYLREPNIAFRVLAGGSGGVYVCSERRTGGWMDGWMGGWMDGRFAYARRGGRGGRGTTHCVNNDRVSRAALFLLAWRSRPPALPLPVSPDLVLDRGVERDALL